LLDYTMDYDSSNETVVDDDLETSLREILPSEGHRKTVQSRSIAPETDAAVMGE